MVLTPNKICITKEDFIHFGFGHLRLENISKNDEFT